MSFIRALCALLWWELQEHGFEMFCGLLAGIIWTFAAKGVFVAAGIGDTVPWWACGLVGAGVGVCTSLGLVRKMDENRDYQGDDNAGAEDRESDQVRGERGSLGSDVDCGWADRDSGGNWPVTDADSEADRTS